MTRQKRRKNAIFGTLTEDADTNLKAQEKRKWIFVGNVNKECDAETIKSHIRKFVDKKDVVCEKMVTYFDTNCFKIGVKAEDYELIRKPECRPNGIKLSRFHFKGTPKKENFHIQPGSNEKS